jgi:hypothetical protein
MGKCVSHHPNSGFFSHRSTYTCSLSRECRVYVNLHHWHRCQLKSLALFSQKTHMRHTHHDSHHIAYNFAGASVTVVTEMLFRDA